MAKLVFAMNQSLDGYVDHMKLGPPVPLAFRHFVEHVRGLTGCIYGRGLYDIMRYWDEDLPDWDAEDRDFAEAWRSKPKWVVSRSLKSVGPNATLIADDFEAAIRGLKAELAGELDVGGPLLAQSLTEAGLIDEYRLYLRPVVIGSGRPFSSFTSDRGSGANHSRLTCSHPAVELSVVPRGKTARPRVSLSAPIAVSSKRTRQELEPKRV